jgi:hypothetical protein
MPQGFRGQCRSVRPVTQRVNHRRIIGHRVTHGIALSRRGVILFPARPSKVVHLHPGELARFLVGWDHFEGPVCSNPQGLGFARNKHETIKLQPRKLGM